jgi:hypothetical protein
MPDSCTAVRSKPPARRFTAFVARLWKSAVVWSWGFNGLRLASGLLMLPLLLRLLPNPDLGFYYVLLSLAAIAPVLDLGLSVSIGRSVNYAMGGAKELRAYGLEPRDLADGTPNSALLWKLLHATRALYRLLALVLFVALGIVGTYIVSLRVDETSQPSVTWLSWGAALLNAVFDLYSSWWNSFLRNMNQVLVSGRILFLAYALKLVLACGLLLLGWGLLSVPVAGLFSCLVIRQLSRRACLRALPSHTSAPPSRAETFSLVRTLWPTSWRAGLQNGSGCLTTSLYAIICLKIFGLAANAEYGLSLQIATIIQGMALVWTGVKWPLVGQYRARHDHTALRRLLWPRVWLQSITFIVLALIAYVLAPYLLQWIGSDKKILPSGWFLLLLFNAFLETQIVFWTTLLSMENRIPSLWAVVTTNAAALVLVLLLVNFTHLHLGAFVLAPLLAGSLFNYWFWAKEGARSLQTTWLQFTFFRPA